MARAFHTLNKACTYEYEEKRSRFLAFLWPVASKDEGFEHLEKLKAQYPDARHHCWAYLMGDPEQALSAGFNDDGEPGGTAGKPMLNVLSQRKVGNVFAVVVRYFGGVKLGAGGLTRAYGQAISRALDDAELRLMVPMIQLEIQTPFALEEKVRNVLQKNQINQIDVTYTHEVILRCECPHSEAEQIINAIVEATSGQANAQTIDD